MSNYIAKPCVHREGQCPYRSQDYPDNGARYCSKKGNCIREELDIDADTAGKTKAKTITIDFDGYLCEDRYPEIGEPIAESIEYCIAARCCGDRICLRTRRKGELLGKAKMWCAEHGLIIDEAIYEPPVSCRYGEGGSNLIDEPAEEARPGPDYKAMLAEWQERLGLGEWRIKLIAGCHPNDMEQINVSGEADWSEVGKTVVIRILNPIYFGDRIAPYDIEKTLVHELLHLKFCLLGESGNYLRDRYVHQMIDDLARALVCAKRGTLRIGLAED